MSWLAPRLLPSPRLFLFSTLPLFHLGCAVHYHDAKTGTEHVWGLAHVKMRVVSREGAPAAVITRADTFGLGLHAGPAEGGLALGWDRRTRVFVPDDSALSIEWPDSDLFDVRIGQPTPFPAAASASSAAASR